MLRRCLGSLAVLTLAVALLPARARGDDQRPAAAHRPHRSDNFWEWVINPHEAEINTVLTKVRDIRGTIVQFAASADVNYSEAVREKGLTEALGMLAYALRLQPDNTEVQKQYAYVAHDLGRAELARRMLAEYLHNEVPERLEASAHARLGRLEADAGQWSEAVIQLRRAMARDKQLTAPGEYAQTVLCLASVYMHTGRMTEAIDLLESATGDTRRPVFDMGWEQQFLRFALAVAYDRDEQVTRAHEILDGLLQSAAHSGASTVFLGLLSNQGYSNTRPLEFTPAFDQHYFTALLYEAAGHLVEARTEWDAYLRHGARAPYRARARVHVEAIDELMAARLKGPARQTRRSR